MELKRGQRVELAEQADCGLAQFSIEVGGVASEGIQIAAIVAYGENLLELVHAERNSAAQGKIRLRRGASGPARFSVQLKDLSPELTEVFFVLSLPEEHRSAGRHFGSLGASELQVSHQGRAHSSFRFNGDHFGQETAIYLARLYRHTNSWKLAIKGTGYEAGLPALFAQLGLGPEHAAKLDAVTESTDDNSNDLSTSDAMRQIHDAVLHLTAEHGSEFYGRGGARVRAYLMDTVPGARREADLVARALDAGILEELQKQHQSMALVFPRLVKNLERDCWIPEEAAKWAIQVWWEAFGQSGGQELIAVEAPRTSKRQSATGSPSQPPSPQPVADTPPAQEVSRPEDPADIKRLKNGERWQLPGEYERSLVYVTLSSHRAQPMVIQSICVMLDPTGQPAFADAFSHKEHPLSPCGSAQHLQFTDHPMSDFTVSTYQLRLQGAPDPLHRYLFLVGPEHDGSGAVPRLGDLGHHGISVRLSVSVEGQTAPKMLAAFDMSFSTGPNASQRVTRVLEIYRKTGWRIWANSVGYTESWPAVLGRVGYAGNGDLNEHFRY